MKLLNCVMTFTERDGKPAVDLSIPGTDYGIVYYVGEVDGQLGMLDQERPVQPDDDTPLPPELEMLYGQGVLYQDEMSHYLSCDEHRHLCRVTLGFMHGQVERSKVTMPHLTEMLIVGHLIAMTNGIPYQMVAFMGLTTSKPSYEANDYEKSILEAKKNNPDADPLPPPEVTLDYECVVPAVTEVEVEKATYDLAKLQSTSTDGSPVTH